MDPTSAPEAILCVDDEGIILLHLVMLLKRRYGDRYRYERASDAAEGLAVVERLESEGARLSILISDWLMPGISGDEFVRSLHETRPKLRSILVSGKSDEDEIRRLCEEAGLAGFLSKPISSEELFALIDRIEEDRRAGT
ncbi:MAG TPA: response regulator [Spirochaetia bacterium]|nr:response regulator [Spirochaetales bacterium]HRY79529.1 response regulator [Spirochaetia bacterium]